MGTSGMGYEGLFQRNLGIYELREQERIRDTKVVIVGCGGIGGIVAIVLARSGVGDFVLLEPDPYEPSNRAVSAANFAAVTAEMDTAAVAMVGQAETASTAVHMDDTVI